MSLAAEFGVAVALILGREDGVAWAGALSATLRGAAELFAGPAQR
jgi:hypothetical protein